jgi:AraC-like DNA-binding protein
MTSCFFRQQKDPGRIVNRDTAGIRNMGLRGVGRLRLEEARRRLLSGGTSAEAVAYGVGYASASQFSREYVRLFGQPPRRDAERMRGELSRSGAS